MGEAGDAMTARALTAEQIDAAEAVCLTWKRMADCTEEFGDFPEACGEFIDAHDTACLKLIEILGGINAIRLRQIGKAQ